MQCGLVVVVFEGGEGDGREGGVCAGDAKMPRMRIKVCYC